MKIKHVLVAVLGAATLLGCNQFKTTKTEEGDRYQLHEAGKSGKKAKEGDILTLDLVIKSSSNDTLVIKDTYKEGAPLPLQLQKGMFKGSFENGLFHLAEGDSATIFVSADSLYAAVQQPVPPSIESGSDLLFIVKIRSIKSQEEMAKENESKRTGESKTIEEWVAKNVPNATKNADGIYHLVKKAGTGATPAKGDTVVVHYTGKFFNGKTFDSSVGREPITFPVGVGYVIPGWEITLMRMKAGESATVVIPSALAYGQQGSGGVIQPFTPLVFDMQLVAVKKSK